MMNDDSKPTKFMKETDKNEQFPYFKTKWCPFYFLGKCSKGKECKYAHGKEELVIIQNLKKTKLCTLYEHGVCPRNQACSYAHGKLELREKPQFYKTKLCINYQKDGFCKFGRKCKFSHGQDELREYPIADAVNPKLQVAEVFPCMDFGFEGRPKSAIFNFETLEEKMKRVKFNENRSAFNDGNEISNEFISMV